MKQELSEIGRVAGQYVTEHLHEFDPIKWQTHEKSELRRKSFTELGMYQYVLEETGNGNPEIREYIVEQVNGCRYQELLLRYPGLFRQNALPAILMGPAGELSSTTEQIVDEAIRDPRLWGKERRPHQLIDLLVQCRHWGYDEHSHRLESVLKASNLVHQPPVIPTGTTEYYRLTHNIMLPTNFGLNHPELLDAPLPYDIESIVTGAVLKYMARKNADVVLELLIVGAIQQQLPDRLLRYAVRWIYEEQTTETHINGPRIDDSEIDNASKGSRATIDEWGPETQHWAKHYHTNLVAGITANVLKTKLDLSDYHMDASLSSSESRDFLALGQALNELESYDLAAAAETLSSICEETFRQFPDLSRKILAFLEAQRTGDSFGYWVDERRLYEQSIGDDSDFEAELVEPISERCRETMAEISAYIPPTPTKQ